MARHWRAFSYESPPRAALGFSFAPLLAMLCRLGLVKDKSADLAEAVTVMRAWQKEIEPSSPVSRNSAKRLAGQMMGRNVVVWGSGILAEVARRWKGQINENAKQWAAFEVLPEADHNAICGTLPDQVTDKTFVVFLTCYAGSSAHAKTSCHLAPRLDDLGRQHRGHGGAR